MKFAVETWAPEYDVTASTEHLEPANGDINLSIERSEGDWSAIDPAPDTTLPEYVIFVDGIRRIDARIWITDGNQTLPGVCASVAAGAVRCDATTAEIIETQVRRGVYATGSTAGAETASTAGHITGPTAVGPIITRHNTYEFFPCVGDTPENLYKGIHEQMTKLETQIAWAGTADLVVFDGPLRGRTDRTSIGFIKTHQVQYLPEREQRVLASLRAGQRSPVFLIGGSGFTRWSWYLRLPGAITHPLSGIVRCELPGLGVSADAVRRANTVAASLPRFASEPHKDARAPQNLYPIAGLENSLRRLLGDRYLLERSIRIAAR